MKKVAFYTLGCKLNYAETSTIARSFEARGYQKVDFTDTPDIFIINTCSVTDNADKKCRKIVKEAQRISPHAYIAIIGCYAQLKPQEIANIPGVDAVLGASEKFQLLDLLGNFTKEHSPQSLTNHIPTEKQTSVACTLPQANTKVLVQDITQATTFRHSYSIGDRTRTFLKVQDGCDYSCTFCTIPLARGSSRSDSIANIVASAKQIAQSDIKEIVLTGVNTGDFGIENNQRQSRFIDLIRALDQVQGIARFRISSIEPNLLTNEIIDFVAHSQRFVPHFHVPLQSGSNKILKRMRRRYLRELYADRVQKIKQAMPQACIGVDVIVGFPTETQADFLDTYHFLQDLDISYLHIFTYSERANTEALKLTPSVPIAQRQERSKMLHNLSDKKRRAFYEQYLNTIQEVLFEQDIEQGYMHGFTANYIRVKAKYDPMLINELKKVRITAITPDLLAEVVEVEETEEIVYS